jgi:hypothetical protein
MDSRQSMRGDLEMVRRSFVGRGVRRDSVGRRRLSKLAVFG